MDSLTQFVLGAAVGDVVAGKKVGNKAMVWGAIGGTIPDLDVFLNLFYPEPQSLLMHRGFSHSIFFAMLAGPLLGFLLHKLDKSLSRADWMKLFFWSIITHPLLDIFTGYGTGLFVPIWDYRIQFDTIFIVDPLYTIPLLVSFVWLLFRRNDLAARIRISKKALIISTGYLALTVAVKLFMVVRVDEAVRAQGVQAENVLVAPAVFTPLLWSIVIKEGDHFWVGYTSVLDTNGNVDFQSIPGNHHLLAQIGDFEEVGVLTKFSKGYFVLKQDGDNFIWNDLRFGTTKGWFGGDGEFIFSFRLAPDGQRLLVERIPPSGGISARDLELLLNRATGN